MQEKVLIWTLDWVPKGAAPRGFVRDLRLRWAAEEAGLVYEVNGVPFDDRATNHLDRQPFGQVPYITHGEVSIFESGACLLHLAQHSEVLMPLDSVGRSETIQWLISALNSIEMVTVPWWFLTVTGQAENGLTGWLDQRLAHMERIFEEQEWLAAQRFTVADLLMADVLRIGLIRAHGERPATEAYLQRVLSRPAFVKAHGDQMTYFAKADETRGT
jgi:glutathione S-transferase